MYQTLKVITLPIDYPVDPDQVLDVLKIDDTTTLQDLRIETLIAAASNLVEHHTRRALLTQTLLYVLPDVCMKDEIELPRPPLQDVNSITCVDVDSGTETTVDEDIYYLDTYSEPGILRLKNGASWSDLGEAFFRISYDAGYGDTQDTIPAPLITAILQLIIHLHKSEANLDVSIPPEVQYLIQPYVVIQI